MGPVQTSAHYVIEEVIPEKRVVYVTSAEHLLQGRSVIDLKEVSSKTECHWHGVYSSKGLKSLPSLFWFKALFERLFFHQLKQSTVDMK